MIYSQEGWRLEHEKPSDRESQIIFKGVVYNEMKGAFVRFDQFERQFDISTLAVQHLVMIVAQWKC